MAYGRAKVRKKYRPQAEQLLDQVREVMRYHHYSFRTERTYIDWIVRFIKFNGTTHPRQMGRQEIERFLTHLACNKNVAGSTQNQAYNAILFLYRHVLDLPDRMDHVEAVRSRKPKRMPTVLTRDEVRALFAQLKGTPLLMARLMYGAGLRVSELVRLRVEALDFGHSGLIVRNGKGNKDRVTILPKGLHADLQAHLERVRGLYESDLAAGICNVYIPEALARKYPAAHKTWIWQYVFPARGFSNDPRTGNIRRHHVHANTVQKLISEAAKSAGIPKRVSPHTLRHSFATHMLEAGKDIRRVQEFLGHSDLRTTMIYTHVMEKNLEEIGSPLDTL